MLTKKRNILFALAVVSVTAVASFYLPISSKRYPVEDVQNIGNNYLEVVRYPLAVKIKLGVTSGACDKILADSSIVDGTQVVTITASSKSKMCTLQLVHTNPEFKFFALPWQKSFTVKYHDDTIYDGRF